MSRLKGEEAAGSAARAPARRPPMSVLSGALLLLHAGCTCTQTAACATHIRTHARQAHRQTAQCM